MSVPVSNEYSLLFDFYIAKDWVHPDPVQIFTYTNFRYVRKSGQNIQTCKNFQLSPVKIWQFKTGLTVDTALQLLSTLLSSLYAGSQDLCALDQVHLLSSSGYTVDNKVACVQLWNWWLTAPVLWQMFILQYLLQFCSSHITRNVCMLNYFSLNYYCRFLQL